MSEQRGREGFVGWMSPEALEQRRNHENVAASAQGIFTRPVYVQPLREGEPVPGETGWRMYHGESVEIVGVPFDADPVGRRVVVQYAGGPYFIAPLSDLTRAPETREVVVSIPMSNVPRGTRSATLTVPASMSDSEVLERIRGALSDA